MKVCRLVVSLLINLLAIQSVFAGDAFRDCYKIASKLFDNRSQAVSVCGSAGSGFLNCYKVSRLDTTLDRFEAIKVCSTAGAGFEDCYRLAKDNYIFPERAVKACGGAGKGFEQCYRIARQVFFTESWAIEACGHYRVSPS